MSSRSIRRSENRILSVIRIKRIHRVDDLGEIVFCLRLSGLVLNCFESGEEQANQNRNDRDHDQQLDERERCGGISSHSAGIMALMLALHKLLVERFRVIVILSGAKNGASGASDIDGCAARVAARESGDERVNL